MPGAGGGICTLSPRPPADVASKELGKTKKGIAGPKLDQSTWSLAPKAARWVTKVSAVTGEGRVARIAVSAATAGAADKLTEKLSDWAFIFLF